jgi:hypothetical protein
MGSDNPANGLKVIVVDLPTAYLVYLLGQDISSSVGDILMDFGNCRQSKIIPCEGLCARQSSGEPDGCNAIRGNCLFTAKSPIRRVGVTRIVKQGRKRP